MELRNSPTKSPLLGCCAFFKSRVFWKESKGAQISEVSTSLELNMSSGAGTLSELHGTAAWYPSPFPPRTTALQRRMLAVTLGELADLRA